MGNSKSKIRPARGGFALFPKLPVELQTQIWTHAAIDWAIEQVMYMTSPPTHTDKTVFMLYITQIRRPCTCNPNDDCFFRRMDGAPHDYWPFELPPMLVVNNLARAVMYDTMLSICRAGEKIPRGRDVCVYIKEDVQSKNEFGTPKYYGLRIQDMRPPGLGERMKEEKERLIEMQAELTELVVLGLHQSGRQSPWADPDFVKNVVFRREKPEGWFRLPLFYGVAYYQVDQGELWINKHIK